MLILPSQVHDLGHFCFSDFVGVNAADADPATVDVQHDPLRFRFRLLGTEQVRLWDSDPTGLWMDERFPHLAKDAPTYAYLVKSAEQGVVCYNRGFPVVHVPKDYILTERILLPLAEDGKQVDVVLGLSVYHFDEVMPAPVH